MPLISIKVRTSAGLIPVTFYQTGSIVQDPVPQLPITYATDGFTLTQLLLLVYVAVTAFFLIRFFINVSSLVKKIKHSSSVPYLDARFVLTEDKLVPYSFLKYVFIHNEDFVTGNVEGEILRHELTHVKQKHSFDILFIELLLIFAWINPFLFFYRKAIQLNHEFLADESVVKKFNDAKTYQLLLIDKALQPSRLLLSSQFNYLLVKKRITMMSKKTSYKVAILKQIALIPVIVAAGFVFSTKVIAQDKRTTPDQPLTRSTQSGVLQEPPGSMVIPRIVPSKDQLESYKDPKIYGVWINEQRVSNDVINNYANTDFANVMVSKLEKNAINYGKHDYQVNLMTNNYYQKYYDETIAKKDFISIMIADFKKNDETNNLVKISSDGSSPIVSTLNQQDTDFESWWKSIAKKHGINYESFTVHEPFVIFGKKTIENNVESFNDVVAIAKGIGFKKGENIYSIIKSDKASVGYDSRYKISRINIYNCVVQQFDGNSNNTDPAETRTLKIFGADLARQ